MNEEKKKDLKFLMSMALLLPIEDKPTHVQVSFFEDTETHKPVLYYDVIDTSKVKLKEE